LSRALNLILDLNLPCMNRLRRECLDHVIVLNEEHLRGILQEYVRYYNTQRTHLGIGKDSPKPGEVQADGQIEKGAVVGGPHHCCFRRAA
jgi:hypothetical protein